MKKQRNLKIVLMAGAMCLMLAACGDKKDGNDAVITPDNTTQATQESVSDPSQESTSSGNNTVSENTAVEFRNDVAVADVEAAVADALGENYWPVESIESLEALEITSDMYEEFIYKVPMISANVDTLIVIKAAEGKVQDVEDKVNAFRDANINDLMQYPMNLVMIQCSKVVTMGNYVAFVQLGADEVMKATTNLPATMSDDEIAKIEMEAVEAQNDIAINAMKAALAK